MTRSKSAQLGAAVVALLMAVVALLMAVVALLAAGGVFVLCVRAGLLTPSDQALRATYRLPNSNFIDIDGEPIHYVDEGSGEAILLLHGSFGSLRMWSDWARALTPRYRVVRFDIPPMGLSGPNPTARYDTDHDLQIMAKLTARLGLKRFFLVGTSSAGIAAAAYGALHPEQIEGLILSNIAVGSFKVDRGQLSPMFKWVLKVDPLFAGWHPRELWRQVLLANFADPNKVEPALIREWTDLNNRAQRMPPASDSQSMTSMLARTPNDLPRITVPTLLLWSAQDHELPASTVGKRALQSLGAQDKALVIVPNCGHMMPLECGADSVALARPFLDRLAAREHAP